MINIYCDGGLGNRLLSLCSALYYIRKTNRDFILNWPSNNKCGCYFGDLFSNNYKVTDSNLKVLDSMVPDCCVLLVHALQIKHRSNNIVLNNGLPKSEMMRIFESKEHILYYGDSIHSSLSSEEISSVARELEISKDILDRISGFDTSNKIGIHIRGTDFPDKSNIDIGKLEGTVRDSPQLSYFVCSDQEDTERLFLKYSNVSVYNKTDYVKKLHGSKGWNAKYKDSMGRKTKFNVDRSRMSVIEAFCDMILLSRTQIIKTSNSSFLKCAEIFSGK